MNGQPVDEGMVAVILDVLRPERDPERLQKVWMVPRDAAKRILEAIEAEEYRRYSADQCAAEMLAEARPEDFF